MKPSEVLEILQPLWSVFAKTAPPNTALPSYGQYLTDLEAASLKAAIDEIILTQKFFPAIAEIREVAARHLRADLPSAEDAWLEVNRKIRLYGRYGVPQPPEEGGGWGPVTFSHPAIERAVAVMGWDRLCDGENDTADFAQFRNAYTAYRDREIRAA
ncbi:MAG: hypothetical protein FJZ00_13865, partial [Candidatus Sericytochromatia bacterium]|nr:hypothetical protein [Candidatus Tanganyikabacteria bacterium]